MDVLDELRWRGMLYDATEGAKEVLGRQNVTIYNGFDAQGPNLHVGHLIPIMGLVHMQRFGHTPIALVGGGTSMIGDPGGKSKERNLLSYEEVAANAANIRKELSRFLDFDTKENPAGLLNNADWLMSVKMMDFLRDVGKHFTVGAMLAKDSVKQRMENEEGISYTEFSYMLLQAFDFLTLYREHGCSFQAGGSDQWGNITAGTELIRRVEGVQAHGVVYPLLTTPSGEKFGKTATFSGMDSVWLDANRTSPYRFYQFWFNTEDISVIQYLKLFTLLPEAEINELEQALSAAPERRDAQRRLAEEVTRMVHGDAGVRSAKQASSVLFGGEVTGLSAEELLSIFSDVPSSKVSRQQLSETGIPLVDLVVLSGLESSKGRARPLIEGGGISVNNQRIADKDAVISLSDAIESQLLIMRKGKKDYHVLLVEG